MRIRSRNLLILLAVAAVLTQACSRNKPALIVARMGENLTVGSLIYNVIDTEWKDQLGESPTGRIPSNRFLLVRLSITNSGGSETIIPAMGMIDSRGTLHNELTDGAGVPQWLGMVRRIQPAQTEQGVVLFDVPLGAYTLQVSFEGDDPENEWLGRVAIPLKLDTEPPTPLTDKPSPGR